MIKQGNHDVDYATEEEKQTLFDALENDGKKWNPETKQIESALKVGDICIFWDNNTNNAIISDLKAIRKEVGDTYMDSLGSWYMNAIKCASLEQYINFKK